MLLGVQAGGPRDARNRPFRDPDDIRPMTTEGNQHE